MDWIQGHLSEIDDQPQLKCVPNASRVLCAYISVPESGPVTVAVTGEKSKEELALFRLDEFNVTSIAAMPGRARRSRTEVRSTIRESEDAPSDHAQ